ncbi:hypothetical protein BSKO_02214 [Bryopsis sp. KO-2023]|nr:hypothetical protein BSKO_02214 [Bryopsis sp. KO-2023]
MPRSKRNRVVSLTKTKKKGQEWKESLIQAVHEALDQYPRVILFRYESLRNSSLRLLREELKESSKFLLTPNGLLRHAIGKNAAREYRPNLNKLCKLVKGDVGLMCTKLEMEQAQKALENFRREEFARVGQEATASFSLSRGVVEGPNGEKIPHTMEPTMRKYGLPTFLNRGTIELMADHEVCSEGKTLDVNQAALLRIFGIKMSFAKMTPVCIWENGAFQVLDAGKDGSEVEELEEIEED